MFETVSDMVLQFLIPEVERQHIQQNLEVQENAYMIAVRDVIANGGGSSSRQGSSRLMKLKGVSDILQANVINAQSNDKSESSAQM